jgi:branched-chain amino acid transport system ATP-binding protein
MAQAVSPLLEVESLSKRFGALAVANDIAFSLYPGERVALIGPNGAGKTTLVNMVAGRIRPDRGTIRLAGQDISRLGMGARVRRGLVRTFQVTRLFPSMTAEEHVALAILQRLGRAERMFGGYRLYPEVVAETHAILEELNLAADERTPVREIPYGRQRMLEIALARALAPKVLLLDEPAAGVTASDIAMIERALEGLDAGLAVLMIEHDMDFVFRFAQRVIVLAAGAVIFTGTPAEVRQSPVVRTAYLGSYAQ